MHQTINWNFISFSSLGPGPPERWFLNDLGPTLHNGNAHNKKFPDKQGY